MLHCAEIKYQITEDFKVCHPRCVCVTNVREESVVNQHN